MASRRSKDKSPATDNTIVKKEPVLPLEIINRFTPLGTIPKPNYSSVLVSSYDPYALTSVNQPVKTVFPKTSYTSQYVKKQYFQNLFSIKTNMASITDPFRLATSYFPPRFHWIPEHNDKTVNYYADILSHENSITIKGIKDKINTGKAIYHSVFLNHIISEEMWGPNLASTRMLPKSNVPYSYHDYITAWFRFMLHQNENMTHSWDLSSPNALPGVKINSPVQKAELANAHASTSVTTVKSSVKPKKKGSPLDEIRKDPDALYALLKGTQLLKRQEAQYGSTVI
ncbi:hypothetical protein SO802_021718 [Lithocarpus litseifolius]|uniref:Uncharacterized protein n=1 Tax=Lithocarpus litseifolius TaxID=425828 RepID=A0AAW2CFW9_9ROSI